MNSYTVTNFHFGILMLPVLGLVAILVVALLFRRGIGVRGIAWGVVLVAACTALFVATFSRRVTYVPVHGEVVHRYDGSVDRAMADRSRELATIMRERSEEMAKASRVQTQEMQRRAQEQARIARSQFMDSTSILPIPPVMQAEAIESPSPTWLNADQFFLEADLYPSRPAAMRGLAVQVARVLGALVEKPEDPIAITLSGEAQPGDAAAMSEVFTGRSLEVRVSLDATVPANGLTADLKFTTGRSGGGRTQDGDFVLTTNGAKASRVFKAKLVDKPWVDQPERMLAHAQAGRQIFYSDSPASTRRQAEEMAITSAARWLAQQSRAINTLTPGRYFSSAEGVSQRHYNVAINQLSQGAFISDRFVQRFTRPSGDVYRAALLVDAPRATIDIQEAAAVEHRQAVSGWASVFGSLLGLLALIAILYAFLNAATRGYYQGSLRVAGLVAVVLGALSVLALFA